MHMLNAYDHVFGLFAEALLFLQLILKYLQLEPTCIFVAWGTSHLRTENCIIEMYKEITRLHTKNSHFAIILIYYFPMVL